MTILPKTTPMLPSASKPLSRKPSNGSPITRTGAGRGNGWERVSWWLPIPPHTSWSTVSPKPKCALPAYGMDGRAGAGIDALTGAKDYLDFDPWAEDADAQIDHCRSTMVSFRWCLDVPLCPCQGTHVKHAARPAWQSRPAAANRRRRQPSSVRCCARSAGTVIHPDPGTPFRSAGPASVDPSATRRR